MSHMWLLLLLLVVLLLVILNTLFLKDRFLKNMSLRFSDCPSVCRSVCLGVHHMCMGAGGDQKRMLNPLELELWAVNSKLPIWVLGTEPGSSEEKQAPWIFIFKEYSPASASLVLGLESYSDEAG